MNNFTNKVGNPGNYFIGRLTVFDIETDDMSGVLGESRANAGLDNLDNSIFDSGCPGASGLIATFADNAPNVWGTKCDKLNDGLIFQPGLSFSAYISIFGLTFNNPFSVLLVPYQTNSINLDSLYDRSHTLRKTILALLKSGKI